MFVYACDGGGDDDACASRCYVCPVYSFEYILRAEARKTIACAFENRFFHFPLTVSGDDRIWEKAM